MPANKYEFCSTSASTTSPVPAQLCDAHTSLLQHTLYTPYSSYPKLYIHCYLQSRPSTAPWKSWTLVLQASSFTPIHAPWVTFSSKLRVTASCHHNSIRACILMLLDCCHIIHICFITAHLLNVQDIYLWFFQNEKEKKSPDTVEWVLVLFKPCKLGHCKLFKQMFLCHHIQVQAPSYSRFINKLFWIVMVRILK